MRDLAKDASGERGFQVLDDQELTVAGHRRDRRRTEHDPDHRRDPQRSPRRFG
jgi:hypothetical protein